MPDPNTLPPELAITGLNAAALIGLITYLWRYSISVQKSLAKIETLLDIITEHLLEIRKQTNNHPQK